MDGKALHYVRATGISQSDPEVKLLHHMSVAEFAIHFWREGLLFSEMLCPVGYTDRRNIARAHLGFTKTVCNVPQFAVDKIVYGN